jgi:hypothetical protein
MPKQFAAAWLSMALILLCACDSKDETGRIGIRPASAIIPWNR